ncbi:FAD:protein FMN transferase [Natronomonas sp. EA1]|uniref:FAD:protein FMN transferase n=1 Tax=Natronomonas sp. EA1 TaxID=3421655 RepID=UPI003EBC5915
MLANVYDRLGTATTTFDCCDTEFSVRASGVRADAAVRAAKRTARELESRLNAFDPDSAVAALNREGEVTDRHVAAIVRRAQRYTDRTDGRFAITQGGVEHAVKEYIRGETTRVDTTFGTGAVEVHGDTVRATTEVDLNGLAKGYLVDRAWEAATGVGVRASVNGGGDIARPMTTVGIEPLDGCDEYLKVLETDWHIASSGSYRRRRKDVDHIYAPDESRLGAANELVTVVARRDCMEADALATTLAATPPAEAIELAESWPGLEAFLVTHGVFHETEGFHHHVA